MARSRVDALRLSARRGADESLTLAAGRFAQRMREAALRARASGRPVVAWAEGRIGEADPLDLFARAPEGSDPALWCRPDEGFGMLGAGCAWSLNGSGPGRFSRMRDAWRALQEGAVGEDAVREDATGNAAAGEGSGGLLALGGFSFSADGPRREEWAGFTAASMILHRVTAIRHAGSTRVILAAVASPDAAGDADEEAARTLDLLSALVPAGGTSAADAQSAPDATGPGAGAAQARGGAPRESPGAAEWMAKVEDAAAAVLHGALRKVVLARGLRVRGAGFDPVRALRGLRDDYPTCTLFAVVRGSRTFFGATPERLVRVEARQVWTMALAGSAARGSTEQEDRAFGASLLASAKDRVEHAVVVDAMREALADACTSLTVGAQPALLRFSNVQHLYTPLRGVLREGLTVLDLVERLHPTPAVGGVPRDPALAWIEEREGLDRGWYAAPVGWMNSEGEGEFAVAIRSALASRDEAWLYAGCGIVGDSKPREEYAESNLKLRPMLSALGVPMPRPHDS